jgi:hypothetical protein
MSNVRVFRTVLLTASIAAFGATGCMSPEEETDVESSELLAGEPTPSADIVIPAGPDEGGVTTQATAPACVDRFLESTRLLHLNNGCGRKVWLKVIVNAGPDSACFSMFDEQITTVSWVWPGTYGGLVTC